MMQTRIILPAILILLLTTIATVSAEPEKTLTLGVLAIRPKPLVIARWQPLADYISSNIGGYKIKVVPFTHSELQEAVQAKRLDMVFTNPAHYIVLRSINPLTGVLATLMVEEQNIPLSSFGGVIFARADRKDINDIIDLKNRKIACVETKGAYAAYMLQRYEFEKKGIKLSTDVELQTIGLPQDLIIEAVLSGKTDAGFVRSGMLELLALEGKVKLENIKIINQQKIPQFPFLLSTPLYPEWPFVAMPHLPEKLNRQIATALLTINSNNPAAKQAKIYGFTIPADYTSVENMLRELRLPPFEEPAPFSLTDIWKAYNTWIIAVLAAIVASLVLSILLIVSNRRLFAAKKEAKCNEKHLDTLLNAIPELVWFKDPDGIYVYCNRRFETFFGMKEAEIKGKSDYDFVGSEEADSFRRHDLKAILEGKPSLNEEWVTFASDMHREFLETIKTPVYNEKNNLLGVLGVGRDITGRKQMEEKLTEAMLFLNESQAIAHLAGWKLNPEKNLLYWTDELYRMLEHPMGEPLNYSECLRYFVAEFRTVVIQAIKDAFEKHVPFNLNCRMISSSGRSFWVDFRCIGRLDSEDGEYIAGTLQDITEHKQIEELLITARDMAEAVSRTKTELLATISHELRTPLNGVMGGMQLLEMTELSDDQKDYLQIAKQGADNELALVNDLIDLASLEASGMQFRNSSFMLLESIRNVIENYTASIKGKGLSLEVSLSDTLNQDVVGDSLRLKQILNNLVSNAVKFTREGKITVYAEATPGFSGELLLRFSLTDTGIGIAREDQERIFTPFVQADMSNTRNFGGTGLGLAICRKLSEMMGGRILLESKEGEGSCFVLELPFKQAADELPEFKYGVQENTLQSFKADNITVLVAEDNETNMKAACGLLHKLGIKVIGVEDGKQAVAYWMQGGIDLILMDIQMPVMDGREALRFIRQREQNGENRTPVIALTAFAMAGDKERLLAEGFDSYLSKPFRLSELSEKLKKVLSR